MRIGRGHLVTRMLGVGMGLGFLALGFFAVAGGARAGDRALGLGVALIVVGLAAVVGSITVADPTRIW